MANTITCTCVPVGIDATKKLALLDILMVPAFDDDAHVTQMMSWATSVLLYKDSFRLSGYQKLALKLETAPINPGLWQELLKGAPAQASPATRPKLGFTPIAPYGVSLSDVSEQAHQFHTAALKRKVKTAEHSPDKTFLQGFHSSAVANHGLYQRTKALAATPQLAADTADRIIHARLGVLPPQPATGSVRPVAGGDGSSVVPPSSANLALLRLKRHVQNSLRSATGTGSAEPDLPDGHKHLLFHVHRLVASATQRNSLAAQKIHNAVGERTVYTFNQRITALLNTPTLLRALGLVLRFEIPWDSRPAAGNISLDITSPGIRYLSLYGVSRSTATTAVFLPASKTGAIDDAGWLNPSNGYHAGSLQLDSAALQITQFANEAGLRQQPDQPVTLVTTKHNEDVEHPILPTSPQTAGLYVWQDGLQSTKYNQRVDNTSNQKRSAPSIFYAEDLSNSAVASVVPVTVAPDGSWTKTGDWIHLCQRNSEIFRINGLTISAKDIFHGVRTSAARSVDPSTTEQLSYDVDETLLNWWNGSLVKKSSSAPKGIKSGTSVAKPTGNRPKWPWNFPPPKVETPDIDCPLYGQAYVFAMQAGFTGGGVVSFSEAAAKKAALAPCTYLRYELVEGPTLIPVTLTEHYLAHQGPDTMFIGSRIDKTGLAQPYAKLSQRLMVPPRVTQETALRHGKPQGLVQRGARVLNLQRNALPTEITVASLPPNDGTYDPDPLCTGVWATLTGLDGHEIQSVFLEFYDEKNVWPDYIPHMLQLAWSKDGTASLARGDIDSAPNAFPFLKDKSSAIVCTLSAGQTAILHLRPKLDPSITKVHALSSIPIAEDGKPLKSELLYLSDLCRPTTVRVIHATDEPNAAPSVLVDGSKPTATTPVPDLAKLQLGAQVDSSTTSKVALVASWKELTDSLNSPEFSDRDTDVQLTEVHIKKGTNNVGTLAINFPFSDGRYRQVTVTGRGTARYGDVFRDGKENTHQRTGDAAVLEFLATHAPDPPHVEYVLPNMRWSTKDKRTRTMGLTVVLNRPWYSSGAGEELAIITNLVGSKTALNAIVTSFSTPNSEDNTSAWGVLADWFAAMPAQAATQTIQILSPSGEKPDPNDTPVQRVLTVNGLQYNALCYTPRYNPQDQQWFVNLQLSAPPAYGTVVRLLVARHQPNAIDTAHLSDPVLCEFARLLPERSVSLTRIKHWPWERPKVKVQILGCNVMGSIAKNIRPTSIEVRHIDTEPHRPYEFDWKQGDVVTPDPKSQGGNVLWQKTMNLPQLGSKYVAREIESWQSADDPSTNVEVPVYFDVFTV